MSGDYSKDSFDALRDYAGVFLQQGRPVLDSDWNEMVDIFERRIRAGTVDTIGRAVVPRETPRGFEIRFGGTGIEVGEGHFYLDGVLYQNHGRANFFGDDPARPDPVFDRARPATEAGLPDPEGVLDEKIPPPAGDYIGYAAQPYWPTPTPMPDAGTHLAYLVGWQREVTPIQAPGLLDPALGGVDTTTRQQSVWQVRILPNVGTATTCATPDDDIIGWTETTAPSTARLTTDTIDIEDPEDPCLVPPTEGYTGLENQFYRVEIHAPRGQDGAGDETGQGAWGFKFSRENASVQSSIEALAADATSVTVGRIGRDEVLRFAPGDWVEITDDIREFNHRSGQLLRVADVDPETREMAFEGTVEADLIPSGAPDDTLATRHSRLTRWDQQGVIRLADETVWVDLDADGSDGLIPVPADGRAVVLENGITVSFSTAAGPGRYHEMDHWRFWARTAGTQIETLRAAPPDGVQRHYARLAVLNPNGITDCRIFWPPAVGPTEVSEGCACTVCVTPELHNSGQLTINAAIEQVGDLGGTVCLEAGLYALSEPVEIRQRNAIRLVGQGLGTVLVYRGIGGAVQVTSSNDIKLERFSVVATPGESSTNVTPPVHGVTAVNTTLLALRRLGVLVASAPASDRFDFGIALDGVQVGTKIEECISIAPHALGSRSTYGRDEDGDQQFVALAEVRVLDCILFGGRVGVLFDRAAISIAATILSRNMILSLGRGLRMRIAEIPAASLSIEASTIFAGATAALVSAGTVRVQDCEITGSQEAGDGLVLAAPLVPDLIGDAQIIGNTVFGVAGAGIRMSGAHDTVFIKRNILRDTGQAGVITDPGTTIRHLAIDNNAIDRIGLTEAAQFAVGIGLTGVESGQIVGNSLRNIGEAGFSGQTYGGIVVQAVGSVDISSNVISDVGGEQPETTSVGIFARQPFLGLTINANRIIGELAETEGTVDWRAILIGNRGPDTDANGGLGVAAAGFTSSLPDRAATSEVYFAASGSMWRASANDLAILLPATSSQITVTGNQTRSAMLLSDAMISLFDPGASGITFANNQVDLDARGALSAVVLLGAPRVAVGSNTVVHTTDANAIHIITSAQGAATPVGNITSGRILVQPGGMPSAFAPLNLRT